MAESSGEADLVDFTILGFLVVLLVGIVVGIWIGHIRRDRSFADERARLKEEQVAAVDAARKSSVKQSRSTLTGQMAEKLAPHLPDFPYDPTEVRFLGTPIDYVVFRGLSQNKVEEIIFLEIKTGKSELTSRERSVRNALRDAKVSWQLYRVALPEL